MHSCEEFIEQGQFGIDFRFLQFNFRPKNIIIKHAFFNLIMDIVQLSSNKHSFSEHILMSPSTECSRDSVLFLRFLFHRKQEYRTNRCLFAQFPRDNVIHFFRELLLDLLRCQRFHHSRFPLQRHRPHKRALRS